MCNDKFKIRKETALSRTSALIGGVNAYGMSELLLSSVNVKNDKHTFWLLRNVNSYQAKEKQ